MVTQRINQLGLDLIKRFEGCQLKAYYDSGQLITVGWGHTGKDVFPGLVITQAKADALLLGDISMTEQELNNLELGLNNNQFSALVSFTFNLGIGNLTKSTLLKKIKINPTDVSIRNEFLKWNLCAGKPLSGLTARRAAEATLYFS